jgi:hypothetical protein
LGEIYPKLPELLTPASKPENLNPKHPTPALRRRQRTLLIRGQVRTEPWTEITPKFHLNPKHPTPEPASRRRRWRRRRRTLLIRGPGTEASTEITRMHDTAAAGGGGGCPLGSSGAGGPHLHARHRRRRLAGSAPRGSGGGSSRRRRRRACKILLNTCVEMQDTCVEITCEICKHNDDDDADVRADSARS